MESTCNGKDGFYITDQLQLFFSSKSTKLYQNSKLVNPIITIVLCNFFLPDTKNLQFIHKITYYSLLRIHKNKFYSSNFSALPEHKTIIKSLTKLTLSKKNCNLSFQLSSKSNSELFNQKQIK